eukprot:CAMPEP_0119102448 /NCGR_PEP_ID=MMETSP1180-20130426/1191_1 /TAXON_ID=3052 ORGANISM="Chlamydomonas cf sp, Strain CCMP681" /NCGR_SAMPLE_ID=MMETSP1180 /ASSEMBLY_ACC=CAM_ASM_000741 /LENGTH=87 /DNA_ID=CAMNT_0007086741 /DNA_START=113 /DNA_END=372 /DNA_ORIENTATION=+
MATAMMSQKRYEDDIDSTETSHLLNEAIQLCEGKLRAGLGLWDGDWAARVAQVRIYERLLRSDTGARAWDINQWPAMNPASMNLPVA